MWTAVLVLFALAVIIGLRKLYHPPLPSVAHIFIDFDGTIANSEAFEKLGTAAYASLPENSPIPPLSYFQDIYDAEHNHFADAFGPRDTLARELAFQSAPGRRTVEANSFDRVASAGAFTQVQLSDLQAAAAGVQLRAGWWDFVAYALEEGVRPAVVSLNWSPAWIRLVLRVDAARASGAGGARTLRWLAEEVDIYCAGILPPQVVVPPSARDHPVRLHTGADKVALIRRLVDQHARHGETVFIGDSKADLPPLLHAPTTIGVVAAGNASMANAFDEFGVPVSAANGADVLHRTAGTGRLWVLESFHDIVGKFRGPRWYRQGKMCSGVVNLVQHLVEQSMGKVFG